MKTFKPDFAAIVILEATYTTDEKACEKYGITQRTLQNYRRRLGEDSEFSLIFATKKAAFDKAWAEEFPSVLREATQTLRACFEEVKGDRLARKNPVLIQAVAGAMKLCADVYLTSKVIDARTTPTDRPEGVLPESDAPQDSAYTN